MKRLLIIFTILLVSTSSFADPYEMPNGTKAWGGTNGWKSDINKVFKYFGATDGEPETNPELIGPLTVSGTGNSYFAMPNNATFTDAITGLYLWTFYEGYPYTALNGTLKRLALFEELGTSGLLETPPAYRDSTGAKGQYAYSANGLTRYDCVATNTWFTSTLTDSLGLMPTPPTITGLTLAENGTTLTMVASENITAGSGFSVANLECVGPATGTVAVDSVTSGDGTDTWVMELASAMLQTSEEGAVVFNWAGTADGIEDSEGTDLAEITGMSVTNNSTQTVSSGSLGYIIAPGTGTAMTPGSTSLFAISTLSDYSGILPNHPGTVSYAHIYIPGSIVSQAMCLSIKSATGVHLASASATITTSASYANIPLDTPVALESGVKYYPCFSNPGSVYLGAQSGIAIYSAAATGCTKMYTRTGTYNVGTISLIFDNNPGDPQ